jgi:SAM-dependent methyltransferase
MIGLLLAMALQTPPPPHAHGPEPEHAQAEHAHGGHGDAEHVHGHAHGGHGDAEHVHGHAHGEHGNPEDLAAYVARMEDPSRDAWQKPDEVLRLAGVREGGGQTVCDIGAGPGYFSLRAARRVGERGHVFAVDVEPRLLDVLRDRIAKAGVRNITPVLSLPGDSLLPDGSCDVILIVDTYHHFPDGTAYLRALSRKLRRGGSLVNIDFAKRELPVGPPLEHKVARETFLEQARAAGLRVAAEPEVLPYQYFLVLRPR